MTLSDAQFQRINSHARHTGWRFSILKPPTQGLYVPGEDPTAYEILKAKMGGGAGYDYSTTSAGFKQVLRDTWKERNRTIILHNVATLFTGGAVITLIDHVTGTVYDINATTSDGWPTTYVLAPDHIYFDQETNYLYVSVRGEYSGATPVRPPVILKVNLNQYDASQDIPTCATLEPDDGFLDCEIWEGDLDLTAGEGQFKIFGRIGGRLYAEWDWYNLPGGIATAQPHNPTFYGYFDIADGDFHFLFAYGYETSEPSPDSHFQPPYMGVRIDAATGIDRLKAWDFHPDTGSLNMAFSPVVIPCNLYTAGSYCYDDGWESYLLDTDINMAINHFLDRISTYRYHELVTVDTNIDPVSGNYYYWGIGVSPSYDHTYAHRRIDCSSFAGSGLIEITYTWTYPDPTKVIGAISNLGVGIYFSAGSSGVSQSPTYCAGASTPDGKSAATGETQESIVMAIDPDDPFLNIYIGHITEFQEYTESQATSYSIFIREFPYGASYNVGVNSQSPLQQIGDDRIPDTEPWGVGDPYIPLTSHSTGTTAGTVRTEPTHLAKCDDTFIVGMIDESAVGLGLWRARQDGTYTDRLTTATSEIKGNKVQGLARVGTGGVLVASGDNAIQYYDNEAEEFTWGADYLEFTPGVALDPILGVTYDGDWIVAWNSTEVWWFIPGRDFLVGGRPGFTRHIRNWWDGQQPDAIIGAGATNMLDSLGRPAGFEGASLTHSKGEASYELSFAANDINYMPWVISAFNENAGAPGTYGGTLDHGARILLERGILNENGYWTWLPECQAIIVTEPGNAAGGIATINVTARGIIGTLLTRSVYEFTHRPDETAAADVALITDDNFTYYYESGGEPVYDWAQTPEPVVRVDGAVAHGYTLNTAAGTVEFPNDMSGSTITADFTYYVPGTNEAEDIIICILTHPNEIGGAGLDISWFTRALEGEELTTTDNLTYAFSKNNVVSGHDLNVIYRDGAPVVAGFTWDERDGTVTFGASQAAYTITGDCIYYTIQKSGITLREISFSPREKANAYDCINEVVRRVAPNYIFHEDPDGKLICDYYTQKADGYEDLIIEDNDIALTRLSDNPMYFDLATYVISYGQSPLSELPNLALGKTVTDLWPHGWHAGTNVQVITDGDPATQATGGFGRWSQGTFAVQSALIASGEDGTDMISVDLEAVYEVETIILARGSQVATEGDAGAVCEYSIHISSDGATWERIVNRTNIPPGQNIQFKAGTNYDVGTRFRYIKIALHSLGLYQWKGHTDSQFGISEIQCYESEIIEGIAKLQEDDPSAAFYDEWGLLARYSGHLVHVARGGQPDPALYTQSRVQEDAENILNEMMRLLSQVQADAAYLPGIPLFSTIKIVNGALQRTVTFFVESKNITPGADSFSGANLP